MNGIDIWEELYDKPNDIILTYICKRLTKEEYEENKSLMSDVVQTLRQEAIDLKLSKMNVLQYKDIWNIIIGLLDIKSLMKLSTINKYFRSFIINYDKMWLNLIERDYISEIINIKMNMIMIGKDVNLREIQSMIKSNKTRTNKYSYYNIYRFISIFLSIKYAYKTKFYNGKYISANSSFFSFTLFPNNIIKLTFNNKSFKDIIIYESYNQTATHISSLINQTLQIYD
jgi:hypothetical protein